MGPKTPRSTVLTTGEEAITFAFRRYTILADNLPSLGRRSKPHRSGPVRSPGAAGRSYPDPGTPASAAMEQERSLDERASATNRSNEATQRGVR